MGSGNSNGICHNSRKLVSFSLLNYPSIPSFKFGNPRGMYIWRPDAPTCAWAQFEMVILGIVHVYVGKMSYISLLQEMRMI